MLPLISKKSGGDIIQGRFSAITYKFWKEKKESKSRSIRLSRISISHPYPKKPHRLLCNLM